MATAPPRPDAELLERLRRRDRTAWDELYRTYEGRLYGFAYRLTGNPHDAADLVQETFVRALPKLDRLPPERADVGAYLFATEKNLFLKQVERRKKAQPVEEVPEPEEPSAIEDDPQRSLLLRRQQEEVRVANGKLAPRQRLVLALRELEDKSYAEIGVLVGLNENAVAQLISRARQSLREELRLVQVDRSKLPEECQGYLLLLSAHLDGQLKGAKLQETLVHLEACDDCQKALEDMEEAKRRYRLLIPPLAGVVALRERVDDGLASSGYWEQGGVLRAALLRRKGVLIAAVATLAVLAGIGGGIAAVMSPDEQAAPAPATAAGPDETPVAPAEPALVEPIALPAESTLPAAEPGTSEQVGEQPDPSPAEPGGQGPEGNEQDEEPSGAPGEPDEPAQADQSAQPDPSDPAPAESHEPAPPAGPSDTTAPTVSISSGPSGNSDQKGASFSFSATEEASFSCALDGGGFKACSSPKGYDGLALGEHTFRVRARDAAGNTGPAASRSWTIVPPPDTTAPTIEIVGGPPGSTTATSATFRFQASEPATFECSLDGAGLSSCSSPTSYSGLAPGGHTFRVRATDQAGNRSGTASQAWTIVRPLPDLVIAGVTGSSVTVSNIGNGPAGAFVLRVTGVGSFDVGSLAAGSSRTFTWRPCSSAPVSAVADAGGTVAESNESNNTARSSGGC
jgi:RNA polymerase sigma factor (sigma-70 family)